MSAFLCLRLWIWDDLGWVSVDCVSLGTWDLLWDLVVSFEKSLGPLGSVTNLHT